MMLSADDLSVEQSYFRERMRRHNRELHGYGVARGLRVSVDATGTSVTVTPGFAVDRQGDEVELTAPASCVLPAHCKRAWIQLRYLERPTAPVTVPMGE